MIGLFVFENLTCGPELERKIRVCPSPRPRLFKLDGLVSIIYYVVHLL